MLYKTFISKHIQCVQKVYFFNVKPVVALRNQYALQGLILRKDSTLKVQPTPKGHGLQSITVFTLLILKSISSSCPCFAGTVPVLWIVNSSVPMTHKIWFRIPNVQGSILS